MARTKLDKAQHNDSNKENGIPISKSPIEKAGKKKGLMVLKEKNPRIPQSKETAPKKKRKSHQNEPERLTQIPLNQRIKRKKKILAVILGNRILLATYWVKTIAPLPLST